MVGFGLGLGLGLRLWLGLGCRCSKRHYHLHQWGWCASGVIVYTHFGDIHKTHSTENVIIGINKDGVNFLSDRLYWY